MAFICSSASPGRVSACAATRSTGSSVFAGGLKAASSWPSSSSTLSSLLARAAAASGSLYQQRSVVKLLLQWMQSCERS